MFKIFFASILLLFSLTTKANENVNPEVIVQGKSLFDQLSPLNLKWVYLGRKAYWNTGEKITVFTLPKDNPITFMFFIRKINMLPSTYFDILDANIACGVDQFYPIVVKNEHDMIKKVSETRGGIGYISDRKTIINVGNSVKILEINENAPAM